MLIAQSLLLWDGRLARSNLCAENENYKTRCSIYNHPLTLIHNQMSWFLQCPMPNAQCPTTTTPHTQSNESVCESE
jgi:hypothetical protein